ncbi:MAG: hypothetical protein A4E66_01440 [Syntrophus sp. PtaB.Bin001]|nr:MAG: hypothetical protein A4E66_01440 [Syntrophus sp. PtaB.Bin001]
MGFSIFLQYLFCNFPDIIALITCIGKLNRFSQQFQITEPHRLSQIIHLVSCVVDIIFSEDFITGHFEDVGYNITDHSPPSMADMERPCGVGTDKFNLDFLSFTRFG